MAEPQPERAASGSHAQNNNNNNSRRSQNGRRGNQQPARTPSATPSALFVGSEPLLKENIYDVPNGKNNDQFIKTTKEVKIFMANVMDSYAAEFSNAFEDLVLQDPDAIKTPADGAVSTAITLWTRALKEFDAKIKAYSTFRAKLFLKAYGQCTEPMKSRLASTPAFALADAAKDGYALLTVIKSVYLGFETRRNLCIVLMQAKDRWAGFRQGNMSLLEFFEKTKIAVSGLRDLGVNIVDDPVLLQIATENGRDADTANAAIDLRRSSMSRRYVL
jgi:hypothetical protein